MRKRLMAAAAMAPLMIGFQAAHAQNPVFTISSNTSTPVQTATALNSGPADVVLASTATMTINDTTPAITLNSNNSVTLSGGTINANNVNGATAILVQGPFTGTVSNSGTISLGESYTASDSANNDGLTEAPYAQGNNRIGIRVVGPLTGDLLEGGAVTIQGNSSYGVSIENTLTGNINHTGTITLTGDNGAAMRINGEVTGSVLIGGSLSAHGQGSVGVQTAAPIDGALTIYGTITTSGYAVTARETGTILTNIEKTPADVQQSGSALSIGGNVLNGVYLAGQPAGTVSTDTTTDADGDGIVDSVEGTSALTVYGSAPVVKIGGLSPITLGNVNITGGNAALTPFGLILGGSVTAQGVLDGVTSTAVDIGGAGVNLNGGIRVTGTISASSYEANATAFHLGAGVTGASFHNDGTTTATVTAAGTQVATAIQIDAGASITTLTNSGTIGASATGDAASAIAVIDRGGQITTVANVGFIASVVTPALPGEIVTGKGVALDLSANTTGVTLIQNLASSTATAPFINGDVLLGSGSNAVDLEAGSLTGALSFSPTGVTAAPGSLTINNASFKGPLTYSGSALAISLTSGKLQDTSPTAIGASSLYVDGASTVTVALDPRNNKSTQFNVSGAATFASGSQIGATFISAPSLTGQTFTIVKAGALSVPGFNTTLLGGLPFLFSGSLSADTTANTISLTVHTKGPTELGFNKAETAAFSAVYAALPQDSGIQTAIVGSADRASLANAYDQLLPNSSGDVFETARGMSKAVSHAASDRFDNASAKEDEDEDDFIVSGFWASEFYSGIEQKKGDNNAYHSAALGVIGGYDFGGTGVTISAASSNIVRPGQAGDSLNSVSVVEAGLYAAPRFGALSIDARLGAGYLKASNRREFVASIVSGDQSTTSTISRTAEGDWTGYDLSAHLGAGLQFDVNRRLFFQPRVWADVFHLHEFSYNERNGGTGFDFNVGQRTGTQTNGAASLVTGLHFGNRFVFSPQLEVGYDKTITGGPGVTTARFAYGGPTFSVPANQLGGAALGRLTLRGDGNYVHFSLQAGGEYSSSYHNMDMKAVFRLTF